MADRPMQIGDIVRRHPSQSPPGVYYDGKVVFIHPKRKFFTLEFSFVQMGGKLASYRESFYFPNRAGAPGYTGAIDYAERKRKERHAYQQKQKQKQKGK